MRVVAADVLEEDARERRGPINRAAASGGGVDVFVPEAERFAVRD
jgi:hypothetical protein